MNHNDSTVRLHSTGIRGTRSIATILLLSLLTVSTAAGADDPASEPLPGEEAARTMQVPDGFNVTLFAGEPDVRQPIGFCIDDRGRLWVAEAYSYPDHNSTPAEEDSTATNDDGDALPRDRILIFEDTDLDGRFDERTVFYEGLNYVTGIEVGFGGAWVMSPPYFYFIPDRNRDDVPDGPPEVLLDGFGNHANSHNLANGFAWGPDGWLYGTHGRTNWSMIGKPGSKEPPDRIRFDGGVWRYHPIRHVWEPYCDGTTNPWGIDWDDWGEAFICNCVNPHLFHVIPGAHYEPWRDRESSRYAFERIPTIADHLHYTGTGNVRDGLGSEAEDVAGGGHAHCGTMIYLGDNWPEGYRNTAFLNNIHGKRINNDILRRSGSGYVASHAPDILRSHDSWMMGVTLQYGPDGSVFVLDWSDTGECHSVKNTQKQTGRIYRIAYGTPEPRRVDVASLTDSQLVALQLHPNDWFVRHARRVLQERSAAGNNMTEAIAALQKMLIDQRDVTRKLRALWALHCLSALTEEMLVQLLNDPAEQIRAWAVTLLCEGESLLAGRVALSKEAVRKLVELAESDPSPLVRLHLASVLRWLNAADWRLIAIELCRRGEDTADQNLPLMYWYSAVPLIEADMGFADEDTLPELVGFTEELAAEAQVPLIRRHVARFMGAMRPHAGYLDPLMHVMAAADSDDARGDFLTGLLQGLEGRRTVPMPDTWRYVYNVLSGSRDATIREQAVRLALIFDDPDAIASLQRIARQSVLPAEDRQQAIDALVGRRLPEFDETLLALVSDEDVRASAIRGLAEYQHAETANILLQHYPTLSPTERQDALQTLAARKEWASVLLDAVADERIPRTELSAFTARQIQSLGDEGLIERLREVWGEIRTTPKDRARQMADYRKKLPPEAIAAADAARGRTHFKKLCANCHKLFDDGGNAGPDLTGSQRHNLDYLLENILDPSATVSRDFQLEIIQTESGRVVTGLVLAETDAALTVATVNERVVIPLDEIEVRKASSNSLMPEGLLKDLSLNDVRDLVRYLGSRQQVPLSP